MTCTDEQFIPEDDSNSTYRGEDSFSRFMAMITPLMNQGYTLIDISEDITGPAQRCNSYDREEINQLSTVFSLILQKMGVSMLCTLSAYLSKEDEQHIVNEFVNTMRDLTGAACKASESTPIEAFRLGVFEEIYDERI